jgi:hypothetical protein
MRSVTSPVYLRLRTNCGVAANRRFGPLADIDCTYSSGACADAAMGPI